MGNIRRTTEELTVSFDVVGEAATGEAGYDRLFPDLVMVVVVRSPGERWQLTEVIVHGVAALKRREREVPGKTRRSHVYRQDRVAKAPEFVQVAIQATLSAAS